MFLLVSEDGATVSQPLLAQGTLLIGRAQTCDLVLKNPLASREHAVIHLGAVIRVEDLESANGTRVGSQFLRPGIAVDLIPGEAVFIGTAVLLVSPGLSAGDGSAVLTPKELEQLLTSNSVMSPRPGIGLVRLRSTDRVGSDYLGALLRPCLGPADRLARSNDGDIWLCLYDVGQESLSRMVGELVERFCVWRVRANVYQRFLGPELSCHEFIEAAQGFVEPSDTITLTRGSIVVAAPVTRRLFRTIDRLATADISVLILGETGVGKDVVASAIHDRSQRWEKPFVRVNCAALATSLLETELFGHESGAFTGAKSAKPGLLEAAQGGTVFLDEVGELPLEVQAKLLHVLESREVTRVGGVTPRRIDVRFVSATNVGLDAAVREGTFRADLYFRLNGFTVTVPPLRDRQQEIEGLVRLFIRASCKQLGRAEPVLSPDALDLLRGYTWPGNVRELRNVVDRALLFCEGNHIGQTDVSPLVFGNQHVPPMTAVSPSLSPSPSPSGSVVAARDSDQRRQIVEALDASAGNQSRAAKMLGMPRRSLVRRLTAFDIPRPHADVTHHELSRTVEPNDWTVKRFKPSFKRKKT